MKWTLLDDQFEKDDIRTTTKKDQNNCLKDTIHLQRRSFGGCVLCVCDVGQTLIHIFHQSEGRTMEVEDRVVIGRRCSGTDDVKS